MAASLGSRAVTLGRELTKQFEEVAHLPADALPAWLAADANRTRGEFALLVHPRERETTDEGALPEAALRVLDRLLVDLPLKAAVKAAADITGAPRNALYEAALARRDQP